MWGIRAICVLNMALAVATATGCAALSSRSGSIPGSHQAGEKYPGVKVDLDVIAGSAVSMGNAKDIPVMIFILPLGLVDLPLSFCVDTIMLPLDVYSGLGADDEDEIVPME